nr:3,4-dihydroxy-2-butanone-4-phosphate synthase [Roseiflexus sp.]
MAIASIETALADFRAGRFVIIVDDEHRENEGDLVIAAEYATPQAINFMAREGRGLICVAMTGERLDALQTPRRNEVWHCHFPVQRHHRQRTVTRRAGYADPSRRRQERH